MKLAIYALGAVLCFSSGLRYFYSVGKYYAPVQTKAECEQFNNELQEPLLDCNDRSLTIGEPWLTYGNIVGGFYIWKLHVKYFLARGHWKPVTKPLT